jgi:hypothetical protein
MIMFDLETARWIVAPLPDRLRFSDFDRAVRQARLSPEPVEEINALMQAVSALRAQKETTDADR